MKNQHNKIKNIFAFLLAVSGVAFSQSLTVSTSVNQTQVPLNQQVVFTIELNGEGANKIDQPEQPDMGGFLTFLGSGGTSQNISFVNGRMSVSKSFSFYYLASKVGSFTIPPVKVIYDNKSFESQPINLTITQTAQAPVVAGNAQAAAASGGGDDLFLRAIVSRRRVFQNEPVFVTFRIYAAVSVTGYSIAAAPATEGFWTEDIESPQQPQVREEMINGKRYVTADIKKIAVFSTSPGAKSLGPMSVQCEVKAQARRSRDVFDSFFDDAFFGRTTTKVASSPAVDIEVLPLPVEGRPAEFNGAVGQYQLKATVDRSEVTTDDAVTLKVSISGTGNIRMISEPAVTIPQDFQRYSPNVTENISRQPGAISGSKTFEYVLVPRFVGQQRIKPVTFAYFDPEARTYKRLTSPELVINVTKGQNAVAGTSGAGLSREEVKYVGQDIRYIKTAIGKLKPVGFRVYRSSAFYLAIILPLLLLAGAFVYQKHLEKLSGNIAYARSRKANAMAMRRLSKAKSLLNSSHQKEYYAEVSDALSGFAADKLNLAKAGLISTDLENEFKRRKLDDTLTKEYFELIRQCDFQRFAPANASIDGMETFYQTAKNVIIKLEKAL
jgi:hypothetical protein